MNINLQKYNHRMIENLKKNKFISPKQYDVLKSDIGSDFFEVSLSGVIENNHQELYTELLSNIDWQTPEKHQKTTLAAEQRCQKLRNKADKFFLKAFELLTKRDTNPKVLAIKKELKAMGINSKLDNNLEFAETCLSAMKFLKENNVELPNKIVVSKFAPASQSMRLDSKSIMVLKPDTEDMFGMTSTDSPLHIIVHEAVHGIQPDLLMFNLKKMPQKFKEIIDNISFYASSNSCHEVHAELMTKKLIDGINDEEQHLLDFIEGRVAC